ncbi:MAG: hypothetical protein JNL98_02640 [Bryobacterales bacterium]|nr:hypothetical protein [Bryobacterales bacterium]
MVKHPHPSASTASLETIYLFVRFAEEMAGPSIRADAMAYAQSAFGNSLGNTAMASKALEEDAALGQTGVATEGSKSPASSVRASLPSDTAAIRNLATAWIVLRESTPDNHALPPDTPLNLVVPSAHVREFSEFDEFLRRNLLSLLEALSLYSSALAVSTLKAKRIITVEGHRFYPVTLAAECAQVTEARMKLWVQRAVAFDGAKIKSYESPITRDLYIEEDSVNRLAKRFVKVPNGEHAADVVIGATDDQSGYIHVSEAARLVGIKQPAFWKWASRGEVPSLQKSLSIVKCPISDHMYVLEREVHELASIRKTVGLKHSAVRPSPSSAARRKAPPTRRER